MIHFSIIIPIYNRPKEVDELLNSLSHQTYANFEVILIEDGSTDKSDKVSLKYSDKLNIQYHYKINEGRSEARNYGMRKAKGDYFIFFDSDCVIPPFYFECVRTRLEKKYTDSYGGPDKADASFTDLQKAVNFSMTSFITTGGIRGSKNKSMEKFLPRTFNMGFSREVYQEVGYFKNMFGEDIDFSLRIRDKGFSSQLISKAYVYHKRRINIKSFFRQVFVFGMARISIYNLHPTSLKLVHFLPSLFTIFSFLLLLMSFFNYMFIVPLITYFFIVFILSSSENKKISIGILSILTTAIQLYGYGLGFLKAYFTKIVMKNINSIDLLDKYYNKK